MDDDAKRMMAEGWLGSSEPTEGVIAERRRLADALRRVIDRFVTSDAPESEIKLAADRLETYAEHLAGHPRATTIWGFAETANAGTTIGFFDMSPLIGRSNPLAPPISLKAEGDRVLGHVRFGTAYEGPPGCCHGGFVAAAFDEVLGFAQSLGGNPGMTGTLTVKYRSPTPLHTDLRFEAGIDATAGRKTIASGRLYAGDRLCAEGEGIFVAVDRSKMVALAEQRAEKLDERDGEGGDAPSGT